MSTDRSTDVLVIGGGVAAASTAIGLHEHGHEGDVTLVTAEDHLPYERPPLSKGVLASDDAAPGSTEIRSRDEWEQLGVDVVTGRRVTSLAPEDGTAVLDDGTTIGWDHAVLATGARPRRGVVDGEDLDGVHVLRTIEESRALREQLVPDSTVVVVGGSWIAAEVSAAARTRGATVTMISPDEPMAGTLGADVGAAWGDLHRLHGVTVRTGQPVERVRADGAGRADGVVLSDGTQIAADVVVLGTGVEPDTALAVAAGLDVDDGVVVDERFRASAEGVLAVGDVAMHDHPRVGRVRVEHVEVARAHGRAAAATLVGDDDRYDELPLAYSDQYDTGMEYVGHAEGPGDVVTRGDVDGLEYVAFHLDGDVVRAGHHAGVWDATDVIRQLVGHEVDREVLADEDVALADLPEAATR